MKRNILAVCAGVVASVVAIMLVEVLKLQLYPPPPGIDYDDPEQLAAMMHATPIGGFLMLELAYALGSLAGGFAAAKIAETRKIGFALGIGGLLTLAGFGNLAMAPHPIWFSILSTLTFVPLAWVGAKLATR